ncbi:MAG: hypothetical protein NT030_08090, partial [Candidatus Saganbacteria bacterium]|nr:hypothetical protein [Candidatus Saganbacteria bacterium]
MKKNDFYKNKDTIDDALTNGSLDFSDIQDILKYDSDAAIYFYDNNNNPAWLDILKEKGEFQGLDKLEDIGPLERTKAQYLARVATQKPKEVLDVITNIEARDFYVIKCYFEAILNMPEDELVNSVQAVYKYIDQPLDWWWCGHKAIELMVKLADKNLDKAFEIARKLTEINKVTEEKKKYSIGDAESKFKGHDYRDFLFKYYSKLWEKDAIRASILLIDVFDGYMDSLDNKYDVETGYNHILENLEKPGELYSDYIITIIIQAICKAGKDL